MEIVISANEYADYWRYNVGVNVIPAKSKEKIPLVKWSEFQDKPIPQKLHDEWKEQNKFDEGMAVICGKVHFNKEHEGKWLNGIDCDNKLGLDEMCPSGINNIASITVVEQHANKDKGHIYFYTSEPIKSKSGNDGKEGKAPQIEVKSGGKFLLYCAGSYHKDGSLIEILGKREVKTVDKEALETNINGVCKSFNIPYLDNGLTIGSTSKSELPIKEMIKEDFEMSEGENRSLAILRYLNKKKIDNPEFSEEILYGLGLKFNQEHCSPSYDDKKVKAISKQAFAWGARQIEENKLKELVEEAETSSKEVNVYEVAEQIMSEYNFITLKNRERNAVLFYKDGIYLDFGENIISKRSRKIIKHKIMNRHISEIKGIIKDETGYIDIDEFDNDTNTINLKNCIYNIRTGKTEEHNPEYLSRVKLPIFYDENATCPRFDKFLESSLEGDKKKIRQVLEMMALCLIKDNAIIGKAFMNTGKGSNGKSILFDIIIDLLGKDNVSSKTIHAFETDRFSVSALEGKLSNICADVGNQGITSTEILKKIITGDLCDCEAKFNPSYSFRPFATLIFSANGIPEVHDDSDGFARRWELIEWEKSFYGKDRDKTVKTIRKDPKEMSGIFNKIVKVAKEILQTHELKYETTVEDARQKWLDKSDSTLRFLEDKCALGSEYDNPVAELYNQYSIFSKSIGMTPLTNRKFNEKMEAKGLEKTVKRDGSSTIKIWKGVTLSSKLKGENQTL